MGYLLMFLAGAFLLNCVPHLASGLRGEPHPTPFAKPPGEGLSSPRVNFVWGSANLAAGVALWRAGWPQVTDGWVAIGVAAVGWLGLGWYLAGHFGDVRAKHGR